MGKDALVTVELSIELENEWLLRASSFIRSGNGISGWRTADGLKQRWMLLWYNNCVTHAEIDLKFIKVNNVITGTKAASIERDLKITLT